MCIKRLLPLFLLLGFVLHPATAQETMLRLDIPTTSLQTGQDYEVSIWLDNVPDFWLAGVEIRYDPSVVYIVGTHSGAPVKIGAFFSPGSSIIALNGLQNGVLTYTASQIPPADLLHGSGIIGTFHIYPLAPGTAQIRFQSADILTTTFTGEGAQRQAGDLRSVPFTPVLLELNISGNRVEEPSEATATPVPTATPSPVPGFVPGGQEPTLENVTAAPFTPQPAATPVAPTAETSSSILLILAVSIVLASGLGLVIMLVLRLRQRRR